MGSEPRCDICGRRMDDSPAGFADADWNGETGNHETCEELNGSLDYWKELETLIPTWTLFGWTYRTGASFLTPSPYGGENTLNLTGSQRDDIVKAIQRAKDSVLVEAANNADN